MIWRHVVVALLLAPSFSIAAEADDCADRVDRLRRSTRDASDAAEAARPRGSLEDTRSALRDVEGMLDRAKRECGMQGAPRAITGEQALRQIHDWTARMKKTDPRYLQVEDVLLKHVDLVTKALPPQFWLPTLQLMYAAVADAAPRPAPAQRF